MNSRPQPLVSVIIPVYNMQQYLAETIDSVLASDYGNLEILLVDDGSADDSLRIAQSYAAKDARITALTQQNAGASVARNLGISRARGEYILPLDADDLLSPNYISEAAKVLQNCPNVKVVGCEVEFFGDRTGMARYVKFSRRMIARKNMIANTSMYRKRDWELAGGYCENIHGREDWDFWITLFETGGDFVRLPLVGLRYRVHSNSKRKKTQNRKKQLIDELNKRHAAFFNEMLGGPLRYKRTWSRAINFLCGFRTSVRCRVANDFAFLKPFVFRLPDSFETFDGVIHNRRNVLKVLDAGGQTVVVKSFQRPNLLKAVIYGWFCKSKARRSFEYALRLRELNIGTPAPVGYVEHRVCGCLRDSYYVSKQSACSHTFNDLIGNKNFPNRETILAAIGKFTAVLHLNGIRHGDYSGGNILFSADNDRIHMEIIDLNRLKFGRIGIKKGCRNFERLNIDREALTVMAEAYANARGFDARQCADYVIRMRWRKHVKQHITNL